MSEPTSGPSTVHRLMRRGVQAAARVPFTVVYVVVVLVTTTTLIIGKPLGFSHALRFALSTGFRPLGQWDHWWTPVTAVLISSGWFGLVVSLVAGGAVLAFSERRMGTARSVLVYFAAAIAADVLGAAIEALIGYAGALWQYTLDDPLVLDPMTGVAAVVMAASAFATPRTRRRMRVLTVIAVAMFVLYRGDSVDLYRAIAAFLGLLLGIVLQPRGSRPEWRRSSHHEVRVFMASVVVAGAVGPIVAALSRQPRGLLAPIAVLLDNGAVTDPQGLHDCSVYAVSESCVRAITLERIGSFGSITLTILPLLMLLVVGWGLLRGRRFAVWLGIAMNLMLAACTGYYLGFLPRSGMHRIVQAHHTGSHWGAVVTLIAAVAAPVATAVVLFLTRRSFTVMPSRREIARYVLILIGTGAVLVTVYLTVGWLLRDTAFSRPVTFEELLFDALERFVPIEFLHREIPDFLPSSLPGRILYQGVGPVFWIVAILAAIRPLVVRPASTAADAARARRLLQTYGGDHLAFMTTWPETKYWFSAEGGNAVGYRVVGGVAIALGAAFGRAQTAESAMTEFAQYCDDRGWIPVFYSVDAGDWDAHFAEVGWDRLVIAEEAVIAPQAWATTGKKWQDVRTAVNRAKRDGMTLEWTTYAALDRESVEQIGEISEQWVADKDLPEMGFTLGGLEELHDRDVALMLARTSSGGIEAVTSWMPGYRDGRVVGYTLDFMRRRIGGPNGVMEFLIAGTAEHLKAAGAEYMSLSAAPLARTGQDGPPSSLDRVLTLLATSLESHYGFKSLLSFKRKFQPELRPLLLVYPDPTQLPAIGLALLRAYIPGLSVRDALALLRG
jgi:phosphatidylglycerol lysyltransferase